MDAQKIYGEVLDGGTATLLARIVGWSAAAITQADIAEAEYTVYLLDEHDPDTRTAVTAHTAVELTVADVIYDTLQTDAVWDQDATGYNFRHTVDVRPVSEEEEDGGGLGPAFTAAGRTYLVEVTLTPVTGQVIILPFELACI